MHRNNNLIIIFSHLSCHVFKYLSQFKLTRSCKYSHSSTKLVLLYCTYRYIPGRTVIRQRRPRPVSCFRISCSNYGVQESGWSIVLAALPQRIAQCCAKKLNSQQSQVTRFLILLNKINFL